jgi:cytochrome c-type biogenesis protein CcsB
VEHISVILFWTAFLLYGAAFVLFVYHLVSKRPVFNRWGTFVVVAAWLAQTVSLASRGVSAGHVPVFGAYESLSLIAWFVVLVYLVLELRTNVRAIGLYTMPAVLIFLGVAWANYRAPAGLLPVLKSDLVALHVTVIFTSLAAFILAAGAALLYLIEDRELKRHGVSAVLGRLPSLETLDRLTFHAILFGLPFLSMGIIAGIIRAQKWGVHQWYLDPLVLLAIVAWAVYATFLYARVGAGWRGRRTAYLALAGLVCLLLIRFAAVPFLSNFHTYGS